MGRMARRLPPPSSGAIIFYGRAGSASKYSSVKATSPSPSTSIASSTLANPESDTTDSSGTPLNSRSRISFKAILEVPDDVKAIPDPLANGLIANGKTVFRLAQELTEAFSDVPYVKVVVSLVQQILDISDAVQANKDRSQELISKVATYGRVIFDALLALNDQGIGGDDIFSIREDLLHVASVLQSIYDILSPLATSKTMPRWKKILFREDIASKLAEQDRRLDTAITAFQLKSSVVLRSNINKVKNDKGQSSLQTPPNHLFHSRGLRSRPQIVFGRDKEINEIVKTLTQVNSADEDEEAVLPPRVCILGSGGIGKTTLALSVVHHKDICNRFEGRRFFVSCEAATSADLLLSEIVTALGFEAEEVKANALQAVLRRLQQAACLLVLDNFETPWDPPQYRSSVENLLTEITSLETVTLILTMRGSQRPAGTLWSQVVPPLQPVNEDSALSIFKSISGKGDHNAINLIRAVDCVPLAVTLLANLAAVDGETTEVLWLRWKEEHTSMIEDGQDRLNSIESSIQVSLSSPRMRRDPGALSLLSALSLLPDGVSANTLESCIQGFPEVVSVKKAISTLRQNALVFEDTHKDIRILSPVRLYICKQYPPSLKAREFVYDHFINLALQGIRYHDPTVRLVLQREANNISAILVDALTSLKEESARDVIQATINFCHFIYVSGKGSSQAISIAVGKLETLRISTTAVPSLDQHSPDTSWYKTFRMFGKASKSAHALPATNTTVGVVSNSTLQADCLGCWGQILCRQREFDLAQQKFTRAYELHSQLGDTAGQAYDLLNQGLLLSREFRKLEEALGLFEQAYELHEELKDKAGMAHDLLASGHASRDLGRFLDAQDRFTSASDLFEALDDIAGQASALNGLGAIMLFLSECSEAERFFKKAVDLSRKVGDTVMEAESVAGVAMACLLQSRFLEAKLEIEKAMALRQPAVEPDHLYVLGRVYVAMEDYDQAEHHLSQALSYHDETGDLRGQAEVLLVLASVAFYRGDCQGAYGYASSATNKLPGNRFILAESSIVEALIYTREYDFPEASWLLEEALAIFEKVGSKLGQAQCLYIGARQHIHYAQWDRAMESLNKALDFHIEVGNMQGQADDMNLISETLMCKGSIGEAMALVAEALALHIRIGDKSGQGDDLYVQASLLLLEGRFEDAEMTMRKALEFHTAGHSLYGIGRDSASLSDILWQKQQQARAMGRDNDYIAPDGEEAPITHLTRALEIFKKIQAAGEFVVCRAQRRRILGKEPLDVHDISLPNYYLTDEESSEEEEDGEEEGDESNSECEAP